MDGVNEAVMMPMPEGLSKQVGEAIWRLFDRDVESGVPYNEAIGRHNALLSHLRRYMESDIGEVEQSVDQEAIALAYLSGSQNGTSRRHYGPP